MRNNYLTPELKKLYTEDFDSVNNVESDFWKIDNEIFEHLKAINCNPKIQTLYSKYGVSDTMLGSYLEFCYSKELEDKFFKSFLPEFLNEFNDIREVSCTYEFHYPHDNANYNEEVKLGQSATDNPDHFRINHLRLTLRSYNRRVHDRFWLEIKNRLEVFK